MHALTNLELRFIISELQGLVGGRLDNIYGAGERRLRLRFRTRTAGTEDVIIDLQNKLLYLTKRAEKAPPHPDDFIMGMRKQLENAKVSLIAQHNFDRVVVLDFEGEAKLHLVIELFSNGNLILCDANYEIMRCLKNEEWKDRLVRPGEKYAFPSARNVEPSELNEGLLARLMGEKHIIATLARAVPVGTMYLEEALAQADIDVTEIGRGVDGKRLRKLAELIGTLCISPSPRIYESSSISDYALCELSNFSMAKATPFPTLSECIDELASKASHMPKQDKAQAEEKERLEHALKEQEATLSKFEQEATEMKAKGDVIYVNYAEVDAKLKEAKEKKKPKVELDL
ncbi:MAG: NFACT family protein [Candidatus Burarchaeum sp.]|nr:NFACT family protein [Candidatus Burarchaeum sp.]MDO8339695.1 NFACT family protein [Candidatus Burarchaeum sp.]